MSRLPCCNGYIGVGVVVQNNYPFTSLPTKYLFSYIASFKRELCSLQYGVVRDLAQFSAINKEVYFVKVCSSMYLPKPQPQPECDTRSIFKQSKTDLNSVSLLQDRLTYQVQRT